eukprot:CAMPEP_0167818802 /NCGR_PEP_ID=MMETSP0112_2-20121227/5040_1 /TAXON_ID=91324 /ORGANISM="Lotharella globosa, Strain CCCM811" /LENGTH=84 /DNA_ID=CAMNT_0007718893 /DNA_START=100 /DNA_END=354 /DNA_ORIENTATION=-
MSYLLLRDVIERAALVLGPIGVHDRPDFVLEPEDGLSLRILGIDDVQQAKHALVDRLFERVREALKTVVDEDDAELVGRVVGGS